MPCFGTSRPGPCCRVGVAICSPLVLTSCPSRAAVLTSPAVFKPSDVLPAGFVAPCLPTKADQPPSGGLWLHEIKHDGFRVIARKDGNHVRLYSRPGNDLTWRFPLIVQALASLRSRSLRHRWRGRRLWP